MAYTCSYTKIDYVLTGRKLAELLALHSIDVKSLANSLGVSNQAVYKWIHGQSLPSLENFYQISRMMNVTMEDIIVAVPDLSYNLPEIYVREDVAILSITC